MFVGMLSKTLDESQITDLFAKFGLIDTVTVLKDAEGLSKGIVSSG